MTIGDRIKNRRIELGLTQQELAERIGYKGKTAISKIESGERALRQTKIKPVADALETTTEYIMGWEESETIEKLERLAIEKHDTDMLLKYFGMLNDKGRELALAYVKSLSDMKDFQKESSVQTSTA